MNEDWMTVREYAENRGYSRDRQRLARVGKEAAVMMRTAGLEPGVRVGVPKDNRKSSIMAAAKYRVGTYPREILSRAWAEVR